MMKFKVVQKTLLLMLCLNVQIFFDLNYVNSSVISTALTSNNYNDSQLSSIVCSAPFKMADIVETKFPQKNFSILQYGAVGDGLTKNTEAFTKAINMCSASGGGSVVVPSGIWLTGPIKLKSNINLHLLKGALIIFSKDHSDYLRNDANSSQKSKTALSPIYGADLMNVAITGDGIIDGSGETWRPVKKDKIADEQWKKFLKSGGSLSPDGKTWLPSKDTSIRPYMLYLLNCKELLIDGVTIENSPNLTINITRCQDVIVKNTNVYNECYAQNTDGIDISASKNVIVYNCNVNTGDDGICMKSSKNKVVPALENVIVANCVVRHAHGGFVVGSNTDGGMNNIYVKNCSYIGTDTGIRFKSPAESGGIVENVYIDEINMKDIATDAIVFDTSYNNVSMDKSSANSKITSQSSNSIKVQSLPQFQNIHISNVNCYGADEAVNIQGLPSMPVKNIYFNNLAITANNGFTASNTANINFDNVSIIADSKILYNLKNSSNYLFNKVLCPKGTDIFINLYKTDEKNLRLMNTDMSNAKSKVVSLQKIN